MEGRGQGGGGHAKGNVGMIPLCNNHFVTYPPMDLEALLSIDQLIVTFHRKD